MAIDWASTLPLVVDVVSNPRFADHRTCVCFVLSKLPLALRSHIDISEFNWSIWQCRRANAHFGRSDHKYNL